MKQQINLYLPEFVVRKDQLSAELMGGVLAATLALMLLVSGWDLIKRWQVQTELVELRATLAEETQKTEELEALIARTLQDAGLVARLESAEAQYASGLQIRDLLSETALGNMDGFSEYLKDLSRASVTGLSLQQFELTEGGEHIAMAGQVLDSSVVPRYVENLENGRSQIREKSFSPSISRSDADALLFNFELRTSSE